MFEAIRTSLTEWRDYVAWAPDGVVSAAMLAFAAILALVVYSIVIRLLLRLLRERHPHLRSFLSGTRTMTRLALVILALFVVLPAAPLDPNVESIIAKVLLVAAIALLGWAAITMVDMTANLYLMRFGQNVDDDLLARKHLTQVRVLARAIDTILIIATVGGALMTFDAVRHYGVSLFASAGVAGIIAGLAARPLLSNLLAGVQIATSQPIRINDSVQLENEVGSVEEITSTHVVVRLWDLRRLIVPLTYFIEKPFQNWTRESTRRIGAMSLHVDYAAPVERIRTKAIEIVQASPLWDGQDLKLQVTEAHERTIELRVIASARTSGDAYDLACELREKLITFLQSELPSALPRVRQQALSGPPSASGADTVRPVG
jgi:small-conductance mechanosensitive channel